MNNIWRLDISELENFEAGQSEYLTNPEWESVETKGANIPKPVCNHSSVVFDGFMYMFGGSDGHQDNKTFYKLDLNKYIWTEIKKKHYAQEEAHNFPNTRD